MRVEWYGQAAFRLTAGDATVFVDPFSDLGQRSLRDEQAEAIGQVDLLFLPVGGGPTIGAEQAAAIVERLAPRWTVPMHYRTPRIGFLEPADAFLERTPRVHRLETASFELDDLPLEDAPLVVVPVAP
jgi:L-ascorbate metabolism protein UlaG (beta-lactamase superfamily)